MFRVGWINVQKKQIIHISGNKIRKMGKLLTYQLRNANFENEVSFSIYSIGMKRATLSNMVKFVLYCIVLVALNLFEKWLERRYKMLICFDPYYIVLWRIYPEEIIQRKGKGIPYRIVHTNGNLNSKKKVIPKLWSRPQENISQALR